MKVLVLGFGLRAFFSAVVYVSGILEGDWQVPVGDQVFQHSNYLHSLNTMEQNLRDNFNSSLQPRVQRKVVYERA